MFTLTAAAWALLVMMVGSGVLLLFILYWLYTQLWK